ncbi:MAG TPA: ABC transporter permease [Blastocatellia bacterium]|nr:ABC transporter permease [Blastocatellia bacterium]
MKTLWQDVRYGLRVLIKNPGFTLVTVLALALGIGANTAIFTVVNAVLLRPLPYQQPERLVWAWGNFAQSSRAAVSPPDFIDYRDQNRSFSHFAAFTVGGESAANLTGAGEPERIPSALVTTGFFQTFGVNPLLGRAFLPDEDQAGHDHAVVLSYGLWQRRFGGDRNIIGRELAIDGENYAVVGVMPPGFQYPPRAEMWAPLGFYHPGMKARGAHFLRPVARLKPGVTREQAQADFDLIAGRLEQQYPNTNKGWSLKLVPLDEVIIGGSMRLALWVLLGAVGFVLLIACANVANLLLARASARQREIAVRRALGASRLRVIRQLLTESMLLAALGGIVGTLLAVWGVDLLVALSPGNIPRVGEISVDGRVFAFTLLVSLLTGVIFGLVPAWQSSRTDLNEALKEGGRSSAAGGGRYGVRNLLVVAEIALALVLLAGAGLLIRSFRHLQQVSPGFNPAGVLTARIDLSEARYREPQKRVIFFSQVLERTRTLPGVEAVGMISELPMSGQLNDTNFTIEGRWPLVAGQENDADIRRVSDGYFTAIGIPLLRGRHFTGQEVTENRPVVIINQALAAQYFPGVDPVGKRLIIETGEPQPAAREIVGIVGDVQHFGLGQGLPAEMYIPSLRFPWANMVVRTATDPPALAPAIRSQVLAVDPDQPVSNFRTMEQLISTSVAQPRFQTRLLTIFAAVALALAVVGIFGVMSYAVSQRTHEIGIRMALGAKRGDILKLVIGQGMVLAASGVAVGLAVAFALTRVMRNLLFEVSATDPLTFVAITLLLLGAATLACLVPARRATRTDPIIALRYE